MGGERSHHTAPSAAAPRGRSLSRLPLCPQDKVFQFCSRTCCEDYKKLHCIVTFCEYCQEEKTLHETLRFSGVKRPFCSEGPALQSCSGPAFWAHA